MFLKSYSQKIKESQARLKEMRGKTERVFLWLPKELEDRRIAWLCYVNRTAYIVAKRDQCGQFSHWEHFGWIYTIK